MEAGNVTEAITSLISQAIVSLEQMTSLYEHLKGGFIARNLAASHALDVAEVNLVALEQERTRKLAQPDANIDSLEAYYHQQRTAIRAMIRDNKESLDKLQEDASLACDAFEPTIAQQRERIKHLQTIYRGASIEQSDAHH